jgi:5'-methylthioadenosine phosphorylase
MAQARIAVIGGSGLYQIDGLEKVQELKLNTPFGEPSDTIVVGELGGIPVAFLPRHGRGHRHNPARVPARANIFALKTLGVDAIIAVNSCGSFREELAPGHLVIPDQIVDRTRHRQSTFFNDDVVAHVPFDEPVCAALSDVLFRCARDAGAKVHKGGTYIAMEGPAFSTRAESRLYKSWGADIIGMTMLPEAKLAREAEICYASIACVTDYDSWKEKGASEAVSGELIVETMRRNIAMAREIIRRAVPLVPEVRKCECAHALRAAIFTGHEHISAKTKKDLAPLIGKYVK